MPNERANQHRWKGSVSYKIQHVLEEAATDLKLAWSSDSKDSRSYPFSSEFVLNELKDRIKNRPRSTKLPISEPPAEAENLMDLIEEKIVRAVYEDQNSGSYKDAVRKASAGGRQGRVVWRKIVRSIDRAYEIGVHRVEIVPMPRVQFLHRELLDIVSLLKLNDITSEGLVEFFADLCPCGKKHRAEAIRKLRKRIAKARGHGSTESL
jgi:hypothetical protein